MVVKKTALIKDIFRDIHKNLGRFFSIVGIVALGVAFFSGLKIAPEDMRYTADKYYDDYKLMDFRLVSNLGLTEGDLKTVKTLEGVEEASGAYIMDALTDFGDRELVVKVHSFESREQINGARLIEGRFPQANDECLIEYGKENLLNLPLGSEIDLRSGSDQDLKDKLKNTNYKVVGKVTSPFYLSFEKGNTSIGNGQVKDFIMVPKENFKDDIFTDIYLTLKGAREFNSYNDNYFDFIDETRDDLEDLARKREIIRYEEVLGEIREKINEGKEEYYEEKEKIDEKLKEALNEIEDGKKKIEEGERELQRNKDLFYSSIREGQEKIIQSETDLNSGQNQLDQAMKNFEKEKEIAQNRFQEAEKEIKEGENLQGQLKKSIVEIEKALENPDLPEEGREKLLLDLEEAKKGLGLVSKEVKKGKLELEEGKKEIVEAERSLELEKEGLEDAKKKLDKERENLLDLERETEKKFKDSQNKLEASKKELEKAEIEYEEAKEKADLELSQVWEEIEDGEREIKKIEKSKWYILDRNKHYTFVDYGGAADRIDSLAKVFPLFFALVAALVCLTTMTRMVDEQRVNIGTLKALGYTRADIAAKFIIYAFLATLTGCLIGIAVGYTVFPLVIFNAYGMMYVLPPVILRFNILLALIISLVSLSLTSMTSFLAASNELKENPASLMRPKAPKLGKTILIERIPFLWNKFNFSYKVTIRNIFRYKRRFFMTVFGIAGCTALVLTAFGVRDSIRTIVDKQYGEIFSYDLTIAIEENIDKNLEKLDPITNYLSVHRQGVRVENNHKGMDISMILAEDDSDLNNFINLRDRKTKEKLYISQNGVIVTQQVAKILDVKVGDQIKLINNDDKEVKVRINNISENYTFNYIYLSQNYYEKLFGESLEYNEVLAKIENNDSLLEKELSNKIMELKGVNSISYNSSLRENFEDTINSLNYVVLVMIVSAGGLAFVVLYNLTNVNISERIREIATIKVLGFYDNEVSEYIYRENIILTLLGILSGLFMGIFLHRYIMLTVEMENIMFGLTLNYKSYIYSALLTLGFAILVNLAMHYKLKNVEMVESLKSID